MTEPGRVLHTRDWLAPMGHRTIEVQLPGNPVQPVTEEKEEELEMSDEVYAKNNGPQYTPHPEGQFTAVCVDVINMGERIREWEGHKKIQPSVVLVFATGERREDGTLAVITPEFNNSMHAQATLRKFLEGWRGKSYTEEEAKRGVPLHKLTGAPCLMTIEHKTSAGGRTYAIAHVPTPLPKAMKGELPDVSDYVRSPHWEDRKKRYAAEVDAERGLAQMLPEEALAGGQNGDDEIPF